MNTSHKRALSPPEPSSRLDPHRRRCTEQVLVPRCQFQQPVTQLFDPDQINFRLGSLAMIEVQGSHRWRVPWPPISSPRGAVLNARHGRVQRKQHSHVYANRATVAKDLVRRDGRLGQCQQTNQLAYLIVRLPKPRRSPRSSGSKHG
jgi:hypothetical protein